MTERSLLMIPGPINFDPAVLRVLSTPTLSHMSPSFAEIFREVLSNLRKVTFTENAQPLVLAGSGTLAMETALTNLIERGDEALAVDNGHFGARSAEILRSYGVKVDELRYRWGTAARPEDIREKLEQKSYKLVTVTHVDTSTGCRNDVEAIGSVVRDFDALLVVDGVCATAAEPERIDEWGIDVLITASQKALGVPPGLAIVFFSEVALEAYRARRNPVESYFVSLDRWLPIMRSYEEERALYFATPPVNLILALRRSLELILGEGMENVFARHGVVAEAFRSAVKALGLKMVPERDEYAANTMTAVYYPGGVEDGEFRGGMAERGVTVAGGLGTLKGKIFRVGHMGSVNAHDILATIGAMEATLEELGHNVEVGRGLAQAQKILNRM
ncbi:MAG: pyridoxal-phosphate-dependent aminotransferase family protein [Candidatus Geothermarchaeales archaeon]